MAEMSASPSWRVEVASSREERERIFRFRYESYLSENSRWPADVFHDRKMIREAADEGALLFFVETGGQMLGTLRVTKGPIPIELRPVFGASRFRAFLPGETGLVARVFVAGAFRRTTLLSDLLCRASAESIGCGVKLLFGLPRKSQASTFASLGFRACGPVCPHPEMGPVFPHVSPVGGDGAAALLDAALAASSEAHGPGPAPTIGLPAR
jgi:hypothetical protein